MAHDCCLAVHLLVLLQLAVLHKPLWPGGLNLQLVFLGKVVSRADLSGAFVVTVLPS